MQDMQISIPLDILFNSRKHENHGNYVLNQYFHESAS